MTCSMHVSCGPTTLVSMTVLQVRGTCTCGTRQWPSVGLQRSPLACSFFQAYRTGARSLVSYSDGCGGQNKNLTIVGLYNELHLSGVYVILNHKFLTRGHTFLRNDTDFAQIEKRKASATVYVLSDWFSVVKEANCRNPFEVIAMQQEDFLNYKDFVDGKCTSRRFSSGGCTFRDIH